MGAVLGEIPAAGRGYDEEGDAQGLGGEASGSGLGAELGEIPAAGRGYDGDIFARVWRRCVRRCDGGDVYDLDLVDYH